MSRFAALMIHTLILMKLDEERATVTALNHSGSLVSSAWTFDLFDFHLDALFSKVKLACSI